MPGKNGGVFDVGMPECIGLLEDVLVVLYVCGLDVVDEVQRQYFLILTEHVLRLRWLGRALFEDQGICIGQAAPMPILPPLP